MSNSLSVAVAIAAATIVAVLAIGRRAGRRTAPSDEAFLTGGRHFTGTVVAISTFATANTAFMYLGAIGAGYVEGLGALWVILGYLLGETIFFAVFPGRIVMRAKEGNAVTVPDYMSMDLRGPARSRVRALAGLALAVFMICYLMAQFLGVGKALEVTFDLQRDTAIVIGGTALMLLSFVYCMRGGLTASVNANAVQGAFMYASSAAILSWLVVALGGPVAAWTRVAEMNPDLLNPFAVSPPRAAALTTIGMAVAAFGSSLGAPTMLTRIAAARDRTAARQARTVYLTMTYTLWAYMSLVGLLLAVLLPGTADPESALFVFAKERSAVLYGIILAGVSAATLSTTDAALLVGAAVLSDDWARQGLPPAARAKRRIGGVLAFGLIGLLFTLILLPRTEFNVYSLVLFALAGLAGAIGPGFMIVTLRWPVNGAALAAAVIVGLVTALVWTASGLGGIVSEALPALALSLCAYALLMRRRVPVRIRHARLP